MDFLINSWPLLLAIPIFYFFIIRPQAQKQKKQKSFQEDLKKGDEVVTNSGMIGRVSTIEDNYIRVKVDNKTYINVLKNAISRELTMEYKDGEESK